jgi:hypothetical protein
MQSLSDTQWLNRRTDHHHAFRRLDTLCPSMRQSALPLRQPLIFHSLIPHVIIGAEFLLVMFFFFQAHSNTDRRSIHSMTIFPLHTKHHKPYSNQQRKKTF